MKYPLKAEDHPNHFDHSVVEAGKWVETGEVFVSLSKEDYEELAAAFNKLNGGFRGRFNRYVQSFSQDGNHNATLVLDPETVSASLSKEEYKELASGLSTNLPTLILDSDRNEHL